MSREEQKNIFDGCGHNNKQPSAERKQIIPPSVISGTASSINQNNSNRMKALVSLLLLGLWLVDGFQAMDSLQSRNRLTHPQTLHRRWLDPATTFGRLQPKIGLSTASSKDIPESLDNDDDESVRRQKVYATTFNLVKAIAGSGILALPGGVAAMSDCKSSIIPAVAMMAALGSLSAYSFGLYGRVLSVHEANSLGELWEKEKGRSSSWIISLVSMTFCFGAALSYTILLGDTFPALAATLGLGGIFLSRSFWIMFLTMTILFPLSNLRSLLALAPLSMAGVAAVASTTGFLGFRCPSINPFSPYLQGTGALIGTLPSIMHPQFNTFDKGIVSPSATVLMGMAATAYLGHFSAPSFFASLRSKDAKKDARDFRAVTGLGFGIATLLNCLVMSFGFLTFGGASSGVILNNFSTMDPGASICRLLMAVCVIGGFPFLTRSVVTEYLGLRGVDSSRPEQKRATLQVLGLLTAAALAMKDAGFVIGFSGAVMGSFIVYIFPALLFLSQSGRTLSSSSLNWRLKAERTFCKGLVVLGGIVAALGGGVSVANSYFPHLLS